MGAVLPPSFVAKSKDYDQICIVYILRTTSSDKKVKKLFVAVLSILILSRSLSGSSRSLAFSKGIFVFKTDKFVTWGCSAKASCIRINEEVHNIPIPFYNWLAAEKLQYQTKEIKKTEEIQRILESDSYFLLECFSYLLFECNSYLWFKMNKTFALSNIKVCLGSKQAFEFVLLQSFWKN